MTPGVSGAFADLPATSGEAFAEAVDRIERFLVPSNAGRYSITASMGKTAVKRSS